MWFIYILTSAELIFACIIWLINLVSYLDEKDAESEGVETTRYKGLLSDYHPEGDRLTPPHPA